MASVPFDSVDGLHDAKGAALRSQQSSPPKFKRSSVACRRCRRLRVKCVQDDGQLPCGPCRRAGAAEMKTCAFAARGDDEDRRFRIKRENTEGEQSQPNASSSGTREQIRGLGQSSSSPTAMPARRVPVHSPNDVWRQLPPRHEMVSGCKAFTTNCLQVGFIPKTLYIERLENRCAMVNPFLLISLLSLSARFTPELCDRYGGPGKASDYFLDMAHDMVAEQLWKVDIETTQAFFLLGMADWGKGNRDRSSIEMGVAVRLAGLLKLHREETYELQPTATAEEVVQAESARRTFWVIQNHDNLYTQKNAPVSFSKADITTLLPAEENDFAFGRIPFKRPALSGTVPAVRDSSLVNLPDRSLFATLIQCHDLWGLVQRGTHRDVNVSGDICPWNGSSQYHQLAESLYVWETNIPQHMKWSMWNLRGYKTEHVELAYISIVTISRLNNIVLRRSYLVSIASSLLDQEHTEPTAPPGFFANMSNDLFWNVDQLYEALATLFGTRQPQEGISAMLAFCIFSCGSLASYLCRWKQLCTEVAPRACGILQQCLEMLTIASEKWPAAVHWVQVLRDASQRPIQPNISCGQIFSNQEALFASATTMAQSTLPRQAPTNDIKDGRSGSVSGTSGRSNISPYEESTTTSHGYRGQDSTSSVGQSPPLAAPTSAPLSVSMAVPPMGMQAQGLMNVTNMAQFQVSPTGSSVPISYQPEIYGRDFTTFTPNFGPVDWSWQWNDGRLQ